MTEPAIGPCALHPATVLLHVAARRRVSCVDHCSWFSADYLEPWNHKRIVSEPVFRSVVMYDGRNLRLWKHVVIV